MSTNIAFLLLKRDLEPMSTSCSSASCRSCRMCSLTSNSDVLSLSKCPTKSSLPCSLVLPLLLLGPSQKLSPASWMFDNALWTITSSSLRQSTRIAGPVSCSISVSLQFFICGGSATLLVPRVTITTDFIWCIGETAPDVTQRVGCRRNDAPFTMFFHLAWKTVWVQRSVIDSTVVHPGNVSWGITSVRVISNGSLMFTWLIAARSSRT